MKIGFELSILILLTVPAFAQERFIEVTVSDTALVKPDNFVYRISMNTRNDDIVDTLYYNDPAAYRRKAQQKQHENARVLDSLSVTIKKKGFFILPRSLDEIFQAGGDMQYKSMTLFIMTGSLDSLGILFASISKSNDLQGNVQTAFAKNELLYQQNLYKKLLLQADKKALTIAALSGMKLGKVISVMENTAGKNEFTGGWTIYPPLTAFAESVVPGWHSTVNSGKSDFIFTGDAISTSYAIQNTLVVRFAVE